MDDSEMVESLATVKRHLLPLLSALLEAHGLFLVEFNPKIVDDWLALNNANIKVGSHL
jgi:hypothetical protein